MHRCGQLFRSIYCPLRLSLHSDTYWQCRNSFSSHVGEFFDPPLKEIITIFWYSAATREKSTRSRSQSRVSAPLSDFEIDSFVTLIDQRTKFVRPSTPPLCAESFYRKLFYPKDLHLWKKKITSNIYIYVYIRESRSEMDTRPVKTKGLRSTEHDDTNCLTVASSFVSRTYALTFSFTRLGRVLVSLRLLPWNRTILPFPLPIARRIPLHILTSEGTTSFSREIVLNRLRIVLVTFFFFHR